jgi:uncharacterized protein (UPF0179 family)
MGGGLKSERGLASPGSRVAQITLVGERQAIEGHEFVYRGPQPACRECRVKAVCLNQDLGRRYRVAHVREVSHPCLLNEERVRVVEVEPAPPACSLPVQVAVEGAIVGYEPLVCANAACPNFRLCHPVGVDPGQRVRVGEVGPELDCPLGYTIVPVHVTYSG